MSDINANAIDAEYPIPGKDNDSQGFRNNFAAIKLALATATTEISDLQTNAILKGQLGAASVTAIENDLDSSLIKNGVQKQFYPVFANRGTLTTTTTVNLDNGPVQKFTLDNDVTLNISWGNWPTTTPWPSTAPSRCSSVRLMIKAASGTHTVSIGGTVDLQTSQISGTLVYESTLTPPFTVNSSNYTALDVWTIDEGDHVFVNLVGIF